MTSPGHPEIGPELRALMQTILDRIDPVVSAAAAAVTADTLRSPGSCQQVWCPVCALAALLNGEQHPLLTVFAEHSVTVMALLRTLVADSTGAAPQAGSETEVDEPGPTDEPEPAANNGSRYQPIPIVIETGSDIVIETGSDTVIDGGKSGGKSNEKQDDSQTAEDWP